MSIGVFYDYGFIDSLVAAATVGAFYNKNPTIHPFLSNCSFIPIIPSSKDDNGINVSRYWMNRFSNPNPDILIIISSYIGYKTIPYIRQILDSRKDYSTYFITNTEEYSLPEELRPTSEYRSEKSNNIRVFDDPKRSLTWKTYNALFGSKTKKPQIIKDIDKYVSIMRGEAKIEDNKELIRKMDYILTFLRYRQELIYDPNNTVWRAMLRTNNRFRIAPDTAYQYMLDFGKYMDSLPEEARAFPMSIEEHMLYKAGSDYLIRNEE